MLRYVSKEITIKPGGSASAQATGDFLKWTRANLPADEAAQIKRLADTYARTADSAGFSVRIPQ